MALVVSYWQPFITVFELVVDWHFPRVELIQFFAIYRCGQSAAERSIYL